MQLKELKIGKYYLVDNAVMKYCGPVKNHRCDDHRRYNGHLFELVREPGAGTLIEGWGLRSLVKECPRSRKRNLNRF